MANTLWLEKPWLVADCDAAKHYLFSTRAEATEWIKEQLGEVRLYPESQYRILSAAEVREISNSGAAIYDDFGESNKY